MKYHIITFHKCGSRWVRRMFRFLAEQENVNVWMNLNNSNALNQNVDRGAPDTVMLYAFGVPGSRDVKAEHDHHRLPGERTAVFIRDPKDAMISQYWGLRNTHPVHHDVMERARQFLREADVRDGLAYLIEHDLVAFCLGIRPWYADLDEDYLRIVRYESLLADFPAQMAATVSHLGLPVSDELIDRIERRFSFRRLSKGRNRGTEDRSNALRKGVAGDWMNYFDAELAREFDGVYGDVCARLGYEGASKALPLNPAHMKQA